ncbi:MAG: A/G-specific adenine glycosylase [Chlamydiota bacterium]
MRELHNWFQANQRDFPWRINRTPYRVWVSEVMLQQTRASVVIPYFKKWLALFPDVHTLAAAPVELIIKTWEGLGYYSRARNLHLGAKQVVSQFGGEIPSKGEELAKIRGLGPYTIGAILSFGFGQRAPAVDGNVTRVLSRYFAIRENVDKTAVKRIIQDHARDVLDREEPWMTAEALIELGATVCQPKPRCLECPLQKGCAGFKQKIAESLPIKNGEKKITQLQRTVVFIEAQGAILVKKGLPGKVMADLYEFPYFEMNQALWEQREVLEAVQEKWGLKIEISQRLAEVKHTFTRYRVTLYPWVATSDFQVKLEGYQWLSREELKALPFSSGHLRILKQFFGLHIK